jgi:GNAT superfamily N-acetyltransferase
MVRRPVRKVRERFKVRRATPADLEVLVANRRHMWEDLAAEDLRGPGLLDRADRRFRAWARPRLRNGTLVGFLAETSDGRVLGSGCVWLQPVHPRPWWTGETVPYLMAMYTRKEARGQGVASAVVKAAIAFARSGGYPRMTLHASEMGRGVYARLGFERSWEMRYLIHDRAGRMRSHLALRRRGQAPRRSRSGVKRGAGRRARVPKGAASFR